MGIEFLLAKKDFLIRREVEEENRKNTVCSLLHYWYEIYNICLQFCKEIIKLNVSQCYICEIFVSS